MSDRGDFASDRLKWEAAKAVGFADKLARHGWEAATTQEVGLMVREMVRRGEQWLVENERRRAAGRA